MLVSYVEGGHYLPADEWELIGTEITFWDEIGVKVRARSTRCSATRRTGSRITRPPVGCG